MFGMLCALVHAWQAVTPAVVEYLPAGQTSHFPATFRYPALQILGKRVGQA